ncbi:hypothetical protein [Nakamurella leprariae]|uniref:Uncharacterized protein n=1 Tax=Nakamurella leprariae TaxID=2803911 RepID=A0A938Y4V5_9ACTN|nr:hypothetical protein [Nakamurella leprariae]MBM9466096.1 hypothetical protein [Nakamurella leprariae]
MTTATDPRAALEALEAKARAGDPVDAQEMALALAAVGAADRVAALAEQGETERQQEANRQQALQTLADARAAATAELAPLKAAVPELFDAALDALVALFEGAEAHRQAVQRQGVAMRRAGWTVRTWAHIDEEPADLDPANHVDFSQGNEVQSVTVAGAHYSGVATGKQWLDTATKQAAELATIEPSKRAAWITASSPARPWWTGDR